MVSLTRPPTLWPRELSLRSIRGRLALLLALAFLPAGMVAVQSGLDSLRVRQAAAQREAGLAELQAIAAARDSAISLREIVRTLAPNVDLFAANRPLCRRTLSDLAEQLAPQVNIVVMDAQAMALCANRESIEGAATAAAPWLERTGEGFGSILFVVPRPLHTQAPVIAAVARGTTGRHFAGVTQPLDQVFEEAFRRSLKSNGYIALVDASGGVLAAKGLSLESAERRRLSDLFGANREPFLRGAAPVGESWAVATPLAETGLFLVRGWAPSAWTTRELLQAAAPLLLPILLWLLAVAAAWHAVEIFVARPLLVVERLARAYARGEDSEADEQLLATAPEEMTSLRRTLAAMAKTLRGREARLSKALQEERALLREVNHRVKNNLQMVASILSIQSRAANDQSEARGLTRARDRVQLLALAHARIYASGEVHDIALDQLASDIARTLMAAGAPESRRIRLETHLSSVRTVPDRAVPFSFLIGESFAAVMDLLRGAPAPKILMNLSQRDCGVIVLEIVGEGVEHLPSEAPALRLVEAFARQIAAELTFELAPRPRICIEAPPAPNENARNEDEAAGVAKNGAQIQGDDQ